MKKGIQDFIDSLTFESDDFIKAPPQDSGALIKALLSFLPANSREGKRRSNVSERRTKTPELVDALKSVRNEKSARHALHVFRMWQRSRALNLALNSGANKKPGSDSAPIVGWKRPKFVPFDAITLPEQSATRIVRHNPLHLG